MDDLAFLRERIESYADYTNDEGRHLADEQIRAYVGEALAALLERLAPSGAAGNALAATLLRCQFADQRFVRALDTDEPTPSDAAAIQHADRALIELADRAKTIDAHEVGAFITQVDMALDARARLATDRSSMRPAGPQL